MERYSQVLLAFVLALVVFGCCADASNIGLIENENWQSNLTYVRFGAAAWGDVDNDGDLDLALTGCKKDGANDCYNGADGGIYINNGTSLVESEEWGGNITQVGRSAAAWGDVDNDGDLDLIITGTVDGNLGVSKIYTNNGTSLIENHTLQQDLSDIYNGDISWGDVDNDGDLDLALHGDSLGGDGIYINDGGLLIWDSTWSQNIVGGWRSSLEWIDVENDGDLDLIVICFQSGKVYINNGSTLIESSIWGRNIGAMDHISFGTGDIDNDGDMDLFATSENPCRADVYINNGTTFNRNSTWEQNLINVFWGSMAFGDYDSDGDLDLAYHGQCGGSHYARVYENTGIGFSRDVTADGNFINGQQGTITWVDIDNNGILDILMTGSSDFPFKSRIHISNFTTANNNPDPPSEFNNSYESNQTTFSWGVGTDSETSVKGLYYNLRVGTCSDCHDVVSGAFGGSGGGSDGGGGANGYFGNMMERKSITLNRHFEPGAKIYWAVQSIDTGLAKSAWSVEQEYTIPSTIPPTLLNVRNSTVTWNSAVILFDTDIQGNTTIYYGINQNNLNLTASDSGLTTEHRITLTNLDENTTYYYNVTSCNDYGCNTSGTYNFTSTVCVPEWSCSSWSSCQPSGTQSCNQWVDSNNCGEDYSGSNTRGCTYSHPSGPGPSYTPPKTYTFDRIEPGSPMTKEITEGVNVTIHVKNTVSNVDLVVSAMAEKPTEITKTVKGKVYQYLQINSSGIADDNLEEASINFRVSKDWINQNNIDRDSITLHRYHENDWEGLETEFVTSDSDYYYYTANTPGFSYFVIAGEEITSPPVCNNNSICEAGIGENEENCPSDCVSAPERLCAPSSKRCSGNELQECNPLGTVWISKELCVYGCDSETLACNPSPPEGEDVSWYVLVISLLAIAVAAVVYFMKKKTQKPKTLEETSEGVESGI